jgi:SAM-dependent methyltransferase
LCRTKDWYSYYSYKESSITRLRFASTIIYHIPYIFAILRHNPKRILEVGCGRGITSIFLSHFIHLCIGIDSEPKMIQLAKKQNKKFHGRAYFYLMDGKNTSFKSDTFNIVYSQGLLEHCKDEEMKDFIDEWLRLASTCIISVPSVYYGRKDFGDERLLTIHNYYKILDQYKVACSYYGFLFNEERLSLKNLFQIYKTFNPQKYRSQILMIIKRKK